VNLPRVMVDQYAIGRLAAEHLLDRGLRRLAFCGASGAWYSRQRGQGFADRAKAAGVPCAILEILGPANIQVPWQRQVAPLDRWLPGLQRPVGLMGMNDHLARVVVNECQRLGLDVPHEVAVIGSDNDTIVCEYYEPTLSSISRNARRVGYEAAALLDALMEGKAPPAHDILIPPDGVVSRESTDIVNVSDAKVAAAVRFMSDHLSEAGDVNQTADHVAISRRQLELRFRRHMKCTPHEYLTRLRVESAKRLLERREPVKLNMIAKACGFAGIQHLRQAFRRLTGMPPLEYHRQHQLRRSEWE